MNKKLFLVEFYNDDYKVLNKRFKDYQKYLKSIKEKIPTGLYDLFSNGFYYDPFENHKCPHDAWVEDLNIKERYENDRQQCKIEINIKLLGAYHDLYLFYNYRNVKSYNFKLSELSSWGNRAHGDWSIDEIWLDDEGCIVHEIEFRSGARWSICCEDFNISSKPVE